MKKTIFLCLSALLLFSCKNSRKSAESVPSAEQNKTASTASQTNADINIEEKKELAIKKFVSELSDDVKISQLFLVNIEGNKTFRSVEKTSDGKPLLPGGCLLFSYNIAATAEETAGFTKSVRDFYIANDNIPPYIAIDQEGGDVNRLRKITSPLQSQKWVAEHFAPSKANELYSTQAKQMRLLGINMNLAPVAEAENESNALFLDTRTFGDAEKVLSYAKEEISGYESNNIATVLKHFPGNSGTDPHTGLPEITVTKETFESQYVLPFKKLLPQSSAVLMSHARLNIPDDDVLAAEKSVPACLSKTYVSALVRKELGFDGLILSDDIFMKALAENGFPPEKAAVQALEAGIDIIMLSEKRFGSVAAILLKKAESDESFRKIVDAAVSRVIKYKIKAGLLLFEESDEKNGGTLKIVANKNYDSFKSGEFLELFKKGTEFYK